VQYKQFSLYLNYSASVVIPPNVFLIACRTAADALVNCLPGPNVSARAFWLSSSKYILAIEPDIFNMYNISDIYT